MLDALELSARAYSRRKVVRNSPMCRGPQDYGNRILRVKRRITTMFGGRARSKVISCGRFDLYDVISDLVSSKTLYF